MAWLQPALETASSDIEVNTRKARRIFTSVLRHARDHLGGTIDGILDRQGLKRTDLSRYVCHPGGRKVLESIEMAMDLPPMALDHEREVLADYGNMSAPTVFFVLERVLKAGLPKRAVLSALGPGFTASLVSLKRAA